MQPGDYEIKQALADELGLNQLDRCETMAVQDALSDLPTTSLLRVCRATLIAQDEALGDQTRYLQKLGRLVEILTERLNQSGKQVRVEMPEQIRRERDQRAALTRELEEQRKDNARLTRRVADLEERLERLKAYRQSKGQKTETGSLAERGQPNSDAPPWLGYRSAPGRGGGFGCRMPPYGYRWRCPGEVEFFAYEQDVLRRIKTLRTGRVPARWSRVADALNDAGLRTRRGNTFKGPAVQRLYERNLDYETDRQAAAALRGGDDAGSVTEINTKQID